MGTDKRARQKANRQARLEAALAAQSKAKKKRQFIRVGIVALIVIGFLVAFAVTGRDNGKSNVSTTGASADASSTTASSAPGSSAASGSTAAGAAFTYGTGDCPPATGADKKTTFAAAPKQCIDASKTYVATFDTTAGTVKAQLDTSRTPGTTNNFVTLARWHYYDSSMLFRTDPSIGIIQGGGKNNTDSPGYTIPDEGGKFTYSPGDLVMARTAQPNSAGAQFFFGVDNNVSNLNAQGTYVTFGHVTEGTDVLQKILTSNQAQPNSPLGGAPNPPVTVNSITITES